MSFKENDASRPQTLTILDGIGDRLRDERLRLNLQQNDIAAQCGINRATQVSYEAGKTAPNVSYLAAIQKTGFDIVYVLFGETLERLAKPLIATAPNWEVVQQCHDDVALFFTRKGVQCPDRYRWAIVQRLYDARISPEPTGSIQGDECNEDSVHRQNQVHEIWMSFYEGTQR